jgi:hypothetical protein
MPTIDLTGAEHAVTAMLGTALTRDEHLAWCKRRALEYVGAGDLTHAVASMIGFDPGAEVRDQPHEHGGD